MPSKPNLIIDADAIIDLHVLGLWDGLKTQINVVVASTVIYTEVLHFIDPATKSKIPIDLASQISNGITEMSADLNQQDFVRKTLKSVKGGPELDDGELEGIAILHFNPNIHLRFCTCDGAAIRATAILKIDNKTNSFESVIRMANMSIAHLSPKYTQKRFDTLITQARFSII